MESAKHPLNNWDLVDFHDGMMSRTTVSSRLIQVNSVHSILLHSQGTQPLPKACTKFILVCGWIHLSY